MKVSLNWEAIPQEFMTPTKIGNQIIYTNQLIAQTSHGKYWVGVELFTNKVGQALIQPVIQARDIDGVTFFEQFKTPQDAVDFIEQIETNRALADHDLIAKLLAKEAIQNPIAEAVDIMEDDTSKK